MQSIVPERSEKELEQIRKTQQLIYGDKKELDKYLKQLRIESTIESNLIDVDKKYNDFLKQIGLQE